MIEQAEIYHSSHLQRTLHHLSQTTERDLHVMASVRLDAGVSSIAFGEYLKSLCYHFPILRTRMVRKEGFIYPMLQPGEPSFNVYHWDSSFESDDRKQELLQDFKNRPAYEFIVSACFLMDTPTAGKLYLKVSSLSCDSYFLMHLFRTLLSAIERNSVTLPVFIPFLNYAEWLRGLPNDEDPIVNPINPELAELPFNKNNDHKGKINRREITIDKNLVVAINRFAAGNGMSTGDVITSTCVLLIAGLTDITGSFTFALITNGRTIENFATVEGPLGKLVPVKVEVDFNSTYANLCKAIGSAIQESEELQEYFVDDHSGHAVKYPLQLEVVNATSLPEISDFESNNYQFRIKFSILDEGNDHKLVVQYDEKVFDHDAIDLICRYLFDLASKGVAEPANAMKKIFSALGSNDAKVLKGKSAEISYPSIVDMIMDNLSERKNNVAVVFGNHAYNYTQLDELSSRIAAKLKTFNVGTGDIVAIEVEPSLDLPGWMLGIQKTGAAYLPLDRRLPTMRKQTILSDSKAVLLVEYTDNTYSIRTLDHGEHGILSALDATAYVIYTSGTTGKPKGVPISHKALVNYTQWAVDRFEIISSDSTAIISSLAFDLSFTGFWSALAAGASMHLLSIDSHFEFGDVLKYLSQQRISYLKLSPSHLSGLLAAADSKDAYQLHLRLVVSGGEPLHARDIRKLFNLRPGVRLVNHYGPTETTIGTVAFEIQKDRLFGFIKQPVIGYPINNASAAICQGGLPMPFGFKGELCIAGPGLSKGYLFDRALTADRFVHLFNDETTWYKTGDMARILPSGIIELVGRIDDQVKINGYRIELADIQKTIATFEGITDAAVIVDGECSASTLRAFVVCKTELMEERLLKHLHSALPAYMIPVSVTQTSALPLLPNGKINRKQLLDLLTNSLRGTLPATELEVTVAAIWRKVLQREEIFIEDEFFRIGGNSILAMHLVAQINKVLNITLSMRDFFKHNRLSDLVQFIEGTTTVNEKEITTTNVMESYPLSFSQRRLWIIEQKGDKGNAYNMPTALSIEGNIDVQVLEQSLLNIISHYEILRTTFVELHGKPRQVISNGTGVKMQFTDLRKVYDRINTCRQLQAQAASYSFDLQNGPLLFVHVVQVEDQSFMLFLTIHHLVSDGVSNSRLMEMWMEEYTSIKEGAKSVVQKPRLQFKDYAVWHRNWVNSKEGIESQNFWVDKLKQAKTAVLQGRQEYHGPDSPGILIDLMLGEKRSFAIYNYCRKMGDTLFVFMVSILKVIISRHSGQTNISVGAPYFGRSYSGTSDQLGMFLNYLVICDSIDPTDSFQSFFSKVSATVSDARHHGEYPYDLLVEQLNPDVTNGHNAFYDILLVTDVGTALGEIPGISITELTPSHLESKLDMTLFLREDTNGIRLVTEYNASRYEAPYIKTFLDDCIMAIDRCLLDDQLKLAELIGVQAQIVPRGACEVNIIQEDF
jgi:amino acid adenylation domain-containing protein